MNFDEMLDTWRAQDQTPLYGVNKDLLRLVLQHEQASIRRVLRRDWWIASVVGTAMAAFAGVWLAVTIYRGDSVLNTIAAGVGAVMFTLWVGAFWLSRRRQALRERSFGNTLQAEVRRNLSLVEYQLSTGGRCKSALLWTAPPLIGAGLIYWVMAQINHNTNWSNTWTLLLPLMGAMLILYTASRQAEQRLEARRQRLSGLLGTLNASE